ncbi:MAG: nuclear transport factor 2 family protein [Knoellia sp.]
MDAHEGLARWHAVIESLDPAGLPPLVADGAVFRSPAVHAPQAGRDTVVGYLAAAFAVLGPNLSYQREWVGEDSAVLELTARLDDVEVHGIDMITWDEAGLITDFMVMVRPKRGLDAVIEQMGTQLRRFGQPAWRATDCAISQRFRRIAQ